MTGGGVIGLLFSIVIHECAHSVVARHYGIPMHGITLFIFGGVAEMGSEPPSAKSEFLMAIAGPVTSFVIAGCSYGLEALNTTLALPGLAAVFFYLAFINLLLGLFNLVPAFPLDGGRVLRAALWAKKRDLVGATRIASRLGSGFGILLILLGVFNLFRGALVGGVWWIMLGLFVRNASEMALRQVLYRQVLYRRAIEQRHLQELMGRELPEAEQREPQHMSSDLP